MKQINKRVVAAVTLIVFALGMVFGGVLSVFAAEGDATQATEGAGTATARDADGVTMTIHSEWFEQDGKTTYTGSKPEIKYVIKEADTGEFKAEFPQQASGDVYEIKVFTPEPEKAYILEEVFEPIEGFKAAVPQTIKDFSQPITFKHDKMAYVAGIKAKVTVNGNKPTNEKFTLVLKNDKGEVVQTQENFPGVTSDTILLHPINFESDGTYNYTLQQVVPSDTQGITYDTAVYHLNYVVKDGKVTAKTTKNDETTAYTGDILFDNKTQVAAPVNLAVTVKWANDSASDRPKDVTLQLYYKKTDKDGKTTTDEKEGQPVKITADDNWTYTWKNLDGSREWTVKEVNVPSGYSVSVIDEGKSGDTLNRTVLNSKGAIVAGGGNKTNAGGTVAVTNKGTPQTDDISHLNTWITLAIVSLSGMILVGFLLFINRKKAYQNR